MTQNPQVPQICTETKICKTCTFLVSKGIVSRHAIHKCILSNLPKNPNMHACTYYEEGNRII